MSNTIRYDELEEFCNDWNCSDDPINRNKLMHKFRDNKWDFEDFVWNARRFNWFTADMTMLRSEKVLMVGIGFEDGFTCSCKVDLYVFDDPIDVFLNEKGLHLDNLDELLIIREGFKVEQVRVNK